MDSDKNSRKHGLSKGECCEKGRKMRTSKEEKQKLLFQWNPRRAEMQKSFAPKCSIKIDR